MQNQKTVFPSPIRMVSKQTLEILSYKRVFWWKNISFIISFQIMRTEIKFTNTIKRYNITPNSDVVVLPPIPANRNNGRLKRGLTRHNPQYKLNPKKSLMDSLSYRLLLRIIQFCTARGFFVLVLLSHPLLLFLIFRRSFAIKKTKAPFKRL